MLWINQASKAINKSAQHEPKSNKIHKECKRNCQLGQLGVCFPFWFFYCCDLRARHLSLPICADQHDDPVWRGNPSPFPLPPLPAIVCPRTQRSAIWGRNCGKTQFPRERAISSVSLSDCLSVCLIINVKCGLIVDAQWAQAVCELPFNRVPCLLPACLLPLPAPAY